MECLSLSEYDLPEPILSDGLLDTADLLDGIDLSELDLITANIDFTVENSDSDSGISVTCENNAVGSTLSPSSSGTPHTDFVLTDITCDLTFRDGHSQESMGASRSMPTPRLENVAPQSPNSHVKIIPVHPVTKPVFVHEKAPLSRYALVRSNGLIGFRLLNSRHSSNSFRSTTAANGNQINTNGSNNEMEIGSFLDAHDARTHSAESGKNHLTMAIRQPDILMECNSIPCVTPSVDTSPNNLIITRSSIERIRKKQERMIKNRHAASMSRLRKKEYVERLEIRHEQLKRENLSLWRQNEEWRIRCERLETCIRSLQSQIDGLESHDDLPQRFKTEQHSAVCPSSPTVVSRLCNTPASSISPLSGIRSRPCLSLLGTAAGSNRNVASPNWFNASHRSSSSSLSLKQEELTNGEVPLGVSVGLKKSFNSIANSCTSSVTNRLNLVNLTGVVSRHRPGYLQTHRPKVVATTSLLSILCLFTLGLAFPPLNARTDGILHRPVQQSSAPIQSIGHRVLLSVSPQLSVNFDTNGHSNELGRVSNGSSCGQACASEANAFVLTASEDETVTHTVSRTLQHWLQRQKFANTHWSLNVSAGNESQLPSGWRNDSRVVSDLRPTSPSTTEFPSAKRDHVDSSVVRRFHSNRLPGKAHYPDIRPKTSFNSPAQRAVQPFYPRFMWAMDDLLDAAGRRNDTIYLVLSKLDHVHLHAIDPVHEKLSTHLTLIVPAYPTRNASDPIESTDRSDWNQIMLQIDCELRNVSWIHPPGRSGGD